MLLLIIKIFLFIFPLRIKVAVHCVGCGMEVRETLSAEGRINIELFWKATEMDIAPVQMIATDGVNPNLCFDSFEETLHKISHFSL